MSEDGGLKWTCRWCLMSVQHPITSASQPKVEPEEMPWDVPWDVQSFIYLRRIIINLGGTGADVTARIGKNSRTSGISYFCHNDKKREIHHLNSNIKWVLLYGAEILRMTKTVLNRVQTIINSCLRRIVQISFPDKSNICLWRKFSTNARNWKKNARIDWAHAVPSITK